MASVILKWDTSRAAECLSSDTSTAIKVRHVAPFVPVLGLTSHLRTSRQLLGAPTTLLQLPRMGEDGGWLVSSFVYLPRWTPLTRPESSSIASAPRTCARTSTAASSRRRLSGTLMVSPKDSPSLAGPTRPSYASWSCASRTFALSAG